MTILDVAARAGVSPATVSQTLGGRRPVSVQTRSRVELAIAELGYRPSALARGLRTRRTDTIALIVRNIAFESYPPAAHGAAETLRRRGYTLAVFETNDDPQVLTEVLRSIADRHIDGVIVMLPGIRPEQLKPLNSARIPYVLSGVSVNAHDGHANVFADEHDGIAATTRLVAHGTTGPIAYVGGPADDPNAQARLTAFTTTAAVLAGHRVSAVLTSAWSFQGGYDTAQSLLTTDNPPTGVVCANDLIAIGVIAAGNHHGRRCPDDWIITGYDNIEASAYVTPALTTVDPNPQNIGHRSAHALLAALDGLDETRDDVIIPTLIKRESTRPT